MSNFKKHSIDSAPEKSKPLLEGVEKQMGFIPNLFRYLAESPAALESYLKISEILEKSSLSAQEQQIVLLTISRQNGCEFCVAAHSMVGTVMANVDKEIINAVRDGKNTGDDKIDALINFALALVEERGWLNEEQKQNFFDAGYNQQNALDVVLATSLKTLSNYSNHITGTETNPEMEKFAWKNSS